MKKRWPWLMLALLLCVVTAVAAASRFTLAYIAANSNTVRNSFRVEYLPPQDITVPVSVHKTVLQSGDEEISPAGFSFRLMNLDTGEVLSMTSFTDGWATVQLPFTAGDVGKTYRYRLFEVDTGREHIIYDDTVYDISISLALDETYEMSAGLTLNGEAVTQLVAEFVNTYEDITLPDTGDYAQPLLWLALLSLSGAGLALLLSTNHSHNRRLLWNQRRYDF